MECRGLFGSWRGALLAGLVLLAPSTLRAQSRHDDQREAPEVKRLVLKGVHAVDRDELTQSIATEASRCKNAILQVTFCWYTHSPLFFERHYLDRDELKRDLLRIRVFYWRRGWRDAQVDTVVARSGDGVAVTFDIRENAPTRVGRQVVLYDSTLLSQRRLKRIVITRAGRPLNLLELDTTRANLQSAMWDKGYADAQVDTATVVDTLRNVADLTIRVVPNRRSTVGPITISGNRKVAPQTIANSLTLRTGDVFKRNDVLVSQRNLYESNLFRQATISVPPVADTVKPVQVQVSEAQLHEARIGWGFTSVDFFQLQAGFTDYNLFGGARRLDFNATASNLGARQLNDRAPFQRVVDPRERDATLYLQPNWQVSLDFLQPAWLQRPQNALGFGVFGHRRAVTGVYIDRSYGATATFTRTLAERVPLSANYRFEVTRVEASQVFFCLNYGVCSSNTITTLRAHQRLSPLILTGLSDRSDDPFNPTKGYVARVELEHASQVTISDFRYNRAFADGAVYHRMGGRGTNARVVAGHLRLGIVRRLGNGTGVAGELHPRKLFYAGGAQSVRGYAESQLGPRVLTVPPEQLRGAVYFDATGKQLASPIGAVDSAATRCAFATPISQCDPNAPGIDEKTFIPRPLGGTSVAEASAEYRFPVWKRLGAAVFVDAGFVGDPTPSPLTSLRGLTKGTWAVTPGFGARYRSPVGAIRVDVGINPGRSENLRVVTEQIVNGERTIVPLDALKRYSPSTGASGIQTVLRRLTLHLSIGQAY